MKAWAEAQHLLLAAGQVARRRVPTALEDREVLEHAASSPSARYALSSRYSQPAARRFSATVRLGKMPRPPGTWAMPRCAISPGVGVR